LASVVDRYLNRDGVLISLNNFSTVTSEHIG
jgi:hypothetical protein